MKEVSESEREGFQFNQGTFIDWQSKIGQE